MTYLNRSTFTVLLIAGTLTLATGQALPGHLTTLTGETVTGAILPVQGIYGPGQIDHFIVDPGKSDKNLPAKEVAQYTVVISSAARRKVKETYYAKVWPHNGIRVFLKPRQEGKAQLYILPDPEIIRDPDAPNKIVFDRNSVDASKENAFYVSSPDTEFLLRLDPDLYEPALKQMLKDCPELTGQIGKKKFRFKNLENIISYYNGSCE